MFLFGEDENLGRQMEIDGQNRQIAKTRRPGRKIEDQIAKQREPLRAVLGLSWLSCKSSSRLAIGSFPYGPPHPVVV